MNGTILGDSTSPQVLGSFENKTSGRLPGLSFPLAAFRKLGGDRKTLNRARAGTWNLAVAAIFQDEARWLPEWLEYHTLLGVEHFYLYNNFSTDNYQSVLQPYIEAGIAELIEWPYVSTNTYDAAQCEAYYDAIGRAQKNARWLALIDVDELFVPIKDDDLLSVLKPLESDSAIGGVCAAWICFGTSYVQNIPKNKLMIETLLLSEPILDSPEMFPWDKGTFKSIVRPDRVRSIESPHAAIYKNGYSHVPLFRDVIQINHYWTKDDAFFKQTKLSRNARRGVPPETSMLWASTMNRETRNTCILRFVPALRRRMVMSQQSNKRRSLGGFL